MSTAESGSEDSQDINVTGFLINHRFEAYAKARQLVADLYAVKNDRGYPRFSGSVTNVVDEEMKIARFLLGEVD